MGKAKQLVFRERQDKLEAISGLFSAYLKGEVLDVGCDQQHLSNSVSGHYVGVDIDGRPTVRADIEAGLPFRDRSFDTVVALDVLEHCNRIHLAFGELCRLSRTHLLIGLPNMYEWHFRLLFLSGRRLSGKYGLPEKEPIDRHRWIFGWGEARDFVKERGGAHGFFVADEAVGYYGYRRLLPKLVTILGKMIVPHFASLLAYHYCALLRRDDGGG